MYHIRSILLAEIVLAQVRTDLASCCIEMNNLQVVVLIYTHHASLCTVSAIYSYAILWYPCALAYLLCGLRSISCTHLAIINQNSVEKEDPEGEDVWLIPKLSCLWEWSRGFARIYFPLQF